MEDEPLGGEIARRSRRKWAAAQATGGRVENPNSRFVPDIDVVDGVAVGIVHVQRKATGWNGCQGRVQNRFDGFHAGSPDGVRQTDFVTTERQKVARQASCLNGGNDAFEGTD